jgi:hypothetical protein
MLVQAADGTPQQIKLHEGTRASVKELQLW